MYKRSKEYYDDNQDVIKDCKHVNKTPIPDSLATVCDDCLLIFVSGEPQDHTLADWAKDLHDEEVQKEKLL